MGGDSHLLKVLRGSAHPNGIAFAQSWFPPFVFIEDEKLGNCGGCNKKRPAQSTGVSYRYQMGDLIIKEVAYYNCPDIIFVYFAEAILPRRLDD